MLVDNKYELDSLEADSMFPQKTVLFVVYKYCFAIRWWIGWADVPGKFKTACKDSLQSCLQVSVECAAVFFLVAFAWPTLLCKLNLTTRRNLTFTLSPSRCVGPRPPISIKMLMPGKPELLIGSALHCSKKQSTWFCHSTKGFAPVTTFSDWTLWAKFACRLLSRQILGVNLSFRGICTMSTASAQTLSAFHG